MIEAFHWLRPAWLIALLALLPLFWLVRSKRRNQANDWEKVCDPHLLPRFLTTAHGPRTPSLLPRLLLVAALLAILALAGPAWRKLPQPLFQKQGALVVALDLSLSMEAGDLAPSRLERAKLKIADLLKRRREGTTGLIAYAGDAFLVAPLTTDTETIRAQLPALTTEIMPLLGSRPDLALALAGKLLQQSGVARGEILLITDGDLSSATLAQTTKLTEAGRRLSVLAVGTPEGAPIRLKKGGFLQDSQGAIVIPRLEEPPLRGLARTGMGHFARLTADDSDLDLLLADEASEDADSSRLASGVGMADLWHEEGPWLLLLALPLAALGFRRGVLGLMVGSMVMMPRAGLALDWESLWLRPDQQGMTRLQAGEPSEAAQKFVDPAWKGAALYRAGRFEEAERAFQAQAGAEGWYNRGNALARLERHGEAAAAYDEALKLDPGHADARHNRDLLRKFLEEKKPEPSSQPDQPPQAGDKKEPGKSGELATPDGKGPKGADQGESRQESEKGSGERKDGENAGERQEPEKASEERQEAEGQHTSDPPDSPEQERARAGQESRGQEDPSGKPLAPSDARPSDAQEARQADEQWLRRIPDDPGGLLRRKFLYQYQRQGQNRPEGHPW
ncbi:MAG: VWA domain-containing protein [Magnetococcales bacterium]|nr:VWA domain-containing protein [Magnetococcales bacterium]